MAALTELIPLVRRKAPGIMDIMMLDALFDAFKEFCLKSEYIHKTQSVDHPKQGDKETLSVSPEYSVLKVDSIYTVSGNGIKRELYLGDDYNRPDPNTVEFLRNVDSVTITYIEMPIATADSLLIDAPNDMLQRYGDAIAAGAASKLRSMPAQPWTEPNLAVMFERDFTEGQREAYRDRREQFSSFINKARKHNFY